MVKSTFLIFALTAFRTNAFATKYLLFKTRHGGQDSLTSLSLILELGQIRMESFALEGMDLALALTSATAVGAASQLPRLSDADTERRRLKSELEDAKAKFIKARNELDAKVSQFEDSIFEMDKEFEQQTVEVKTHYDETLTLELKVLKTKVKIQLEEKTRELEQQHKKDTSFKLAEQEARMKQTFLLDKLKFMRKKDDDCQKRVSNLLENQAKVTAANADLEETILELQEEIEAFRAKKTLVDFLLGR